MRYILILLFGVLILAKKGFSQSSNDSCSTEINQMMKDFDFSEFEENIFSKFLSRFTDKPQKYRRYFEAQLLLGRNLSHEQVRKEYDLKYKRK